MLIPREFAVHGSIWRVEYKWNLTHNKQAVDGLTDPKARVVYIDRSLTKEDKFWTFIHEFVHVVWMENNLGLNADDPSTQLSVSLEEHLITSLEAELRGNFSMKWRRLR